MGWDNITKVISERFILIKNINVMNYNINYLFIKAKKTVNTGLNNVDSEV